MVVVMVVMMIMVMVVMMVGSWFRVRVRVRVRVRLVSGRYTDTQRSEIYPTTCRAFIRSLHGSSVSIICPFLSVRMRRIIIIMMMIVVVVIVRGTEWRT